MFIYEVRPKPPRGDTMLAATKVALETTLRSIGDLRVDTDVLLAPMTSFRIGGPAEYLVAPMSVQAVARFQQEAQSRTLNCTVLGGGTNVLISDRGISGAVVDLAPGFNFLNERILANGRVLWDVGAGCGTGRLVRRAVARGYLGPEVLAGVPGSLGGALIMNAGGHEGELKNCVHRVLVAHEGNVRWFERDEIGFGYRSSRFPNGSIILSAELLLQQGDPEVLKQKVQTSQTRRKATQPLDWPNAGSIFKNPPRDYAGRLIESAGCKGWQQGQAQVSMKHANFIVNLGGATAADVLALVRRVKQRVQEISGVQLELEIRLLGDFAPEVVL